MPFTTTSDPNFVADENGRIVPADSVDPADITASSAAAPASSSAVDSVLATLDHPDIKAYTAPKGMARAAVQVQRGVDQDTVNNMVDQNNTNASVESGAVQEAARQRTENLTKVNEAEATRTGELIAEARQEEVKQAAKRRQSELQEMALRDQKDPSIDPDQFMRDNGLGMVILAALTGALGAVRKDGGQGTQDILRVIDNRINQNIAKQKGEIESGRIRRGNLIDYYQKQGLDAKQAEAAARALYFAQGDRYIQLERERSSIPDIQSNADILSAQIQSRNNQANQQLTLLGTDKVSEAYAPVKPKAKADVGEILRKAAQTDEALEKAGSDIAVRKAAWAAAAPGVPFPTGKSAATLDREENAGKLTEDQSKAESATAAIEEYGTQSKLVRDPDTNKWKPAPGQFLNPAVAEDAKGAIPIVGRFTDKPIKAIRAAAKQGYMRLLTGAGMNINEATAMVEEMGEDALTAQQLADRLNAAETIVEARRAFSRKGYKEKVPYEEVK